MKKGFTLVELLIVMVIVGTLVAVALPKYQAALERGRAQEAFANLKAASDVLNTQYVLHGNAYAQAVDELTGDAYGGEFKDKEPFSKGTTFTTPGIKFDPNVPNAADILVIRAGNDYQLFAHNQDGELKYIICMGDGEACLDAGFDYVNGEYKMDLTDF